MLTVPPSPIVTVHGARFDSEHTSDGDESGASASLSVTVPSTGDPSSSEISIFSEIPVTSTDRAPDVAERGIVKGVSTWMDWPELSNTSTA